jgi:hypothetical protein
MQDPSVSFEPCWDEGRYLRPVIKRKTLSDPISRIDRVGPLRFGRARHSESISDVETFVYSPASPGHEGKRNAVVLTPLSRVERFDALLYGGEPIPSFLDGLGYFKDPLLSVCVVDYN